MKHARAASLLLCLVALGVAGCGGEGEAPLFEHLPAEQTGITFANPIVEDDALLNPIDFDYLYNGGGVGAGDLDGNGRPDLYFAGNTVGNKLYLNRGDFRFEDVTEKAGVGAEAAWSTGVALVDINQDGLLDIYVCVAGKAPPERRANRLFVNQGNGPDGIPAFTEEAAAYGLADTGYSTQAAFFDYDRDGDLDVYVLTNTVEDPNRNNVRPRKTEGQALSTDRLYRNPGSSPGQAQRFEDVSREAGIRTEGYGLGLAIADVNQDGWPDVYAANDFITNDLLYINNQDGTFTNRSAVYLKGQTFNGMGADIADFNNDARPDIVVLDMLPPDNKRQKLMLSGGVYDRFHMSLRLGYEPQYVRNTLQLNQGPRPEGDGPAFSEIGRLAGVHETDWSWAPLLADLDNDGLKDLFITNGYGKDVTNLDFLAYGQETATFGTRAANRERLLAAMRELPEVRLPNAVFQNEGGLTFTDKSAAWGMDRPSLSNGAAFADLDGDGDLDLVTNNIGEAAFVLKNHTRERGGAHYLRVRLHGPAGNRAGLGAKLILKSGGARQYHDHSPYRGYKSTVENVVHFGLGADSTADSLAIHWPDGRRQLLTGVPADQVITMKHAEAARPEERAGDEWPYLFAEAPERRRHPFEEVAARRGLAHKHEELDVADFKRSPLLPQKYSQGGPGLAVGDVDGNGLDDVFVGADPGHARSIFLQKTPGQFAKEALPSGGGTAHEDMGALFFDAEGDGDLDLYVVSGGNAAPASDAAYQDRLYLNDGAGSFEQSGGALPEMRASGSVVTAADYDQDGDLDLFVGGRLVPGRYPVPPRSTLLRNDAEGGQARFADVTEAVAPALAEAGLVTDALWTDFDGDGRIDLLVAGEWMPLTFFKNTGGRLADVTAATGLEHTAGWWNSLTAGDFDGDGDTDYVAGNLGLNSIYKASEDEPVRIHAKDFDENGDLDAVLSRYIQGRSYPAHTRDDMTAQMVGMKRRFQTYTAYAEAPFDQTFTRAELEGAYVREAVRFQTSYLENRGDGTFAIRPLPLRAQIAPVFGMRAGDYDGDGHLDLLLVGNSYAAHPQAGWYDASLGGFFKGGGDGTFAFVSHAESGFFVDGNARSLTEVTTGEHASLVLAAQNGDSLRAFAPRRSAPHVRLRPLDRYALLTFADGTTRKAEFYHGAGYLSQSSRVLKTPEALEQAVIYDSRGQRRTLNFHIRPASSTGEKSAE